MLQCGQTILLLHYPSIPLLMLNYIGNSFDNCEVIYIISIDRIFYFFPGKRGRRTKKIEKEGKKTVIDTAEKNQQGKKQERLK